MVPALRRMLAISFTLAYPSRMIFAGERIDLLCTVLYASINEVVRRVSVLDYALVDPSEVACAVMMAQ